jgi:hypothetical protein
MRAAGQAAAWNTMRVDGQGICSGFRDDIAEVGHTHGVMSPDIAVSLRTAVRHRFGVSRGEITGMSVTARRGVRGPLRRARAEPRRASRLLATVVSVAGLAAAACGAQTSGGDHRTGRPSSAVILNTTTVGDLVAAFTDAGLAVPNAHDVGPQKCPQIGCIDAVDTDTISIMKFPSTGKAELYAASIPRMFQVEDVVLVFSSAVSPEARRGYEQVAKHTIR